MLVWLIGVVVDVGDGVVVDVGGFVLDFVIVVMIMSMILVSLLLFFHIFQNNLFSLTFCNTSNNSYYDNEKCWLNNP